MANSENHEPITPDSSDYYLELSECRLSFDATSKSKLTNVFYDESNTQVFSIHSGDVTEVVVKSPKPEYCKKFRLEEKGRVMSIKFSPDQKILSVQRTSASVDFVIFSEDNQVVKEFSQPFKTPNTVLLGHEWTGKSELIFVTDKNVTLCRVDVNAATISKLASLSSSINWFIYFGTICLLLLNTGSYMYLAQIKQNKILKLDGFELDMDPVTRTQKPTLTDRDVVLAVVYGLPRILIMNYLTINNEIQAELNVHTIIELASVRKTHILRVNQSGRFAVNVVDNLIIVHNQVSKSSLVFDITDTEFQGAVTYHSPIASPKSIKPINLNVPSSSSLTSVKPYDLYSPNWVMFQPNIVMDAKLGYLWYLELNLFGFLKAIPDRNQLTSFLLLRSNSKKVVAKMLEELLDCKKLNLEELGKIFDQINCVYRCVLEENLKSQIGIPSIIKGIDEDVIDQLFMYTDVFCKFADKVNNENGRTGIKFLIWVLLEYIRSLVDFQIPEQYFLYELLMNSLVKNENYYQLHQLLQYHAVPDSKPMACFLLSLENKYPAAPQLGIDMLERLGASKEEITTILLSKDQILSSLRYSKDGIDTHDRISCKRYLELAKSIGDDKLFYTILTHFNLKNKLRNGNLMGPEGL